ncbi:hypothetical protein HanRHA438_Chr10g0480021 [Helianthus annuus]|uniref:Uncharacterized protein n=1 Tax=Helianthus annuus TaxID=4232 RepID=A0A9K3I2J4_HELAN|nr:hypothetical protein HanXRQr2_Chr10g0466031 [Helianthus annuus]KAJ0881971.1 hypothetical protein HanRHA438_Chr10g0480021 [Helianthus annuus]
MASRWLIAGEILTPTRSAPMAAATACTTCSKNLQRFSKEPPYSSVLSLIPSFMN